MGGGEYSTNLNLKMSKSSMRISNPLGGGGFYQPQTQTFEVLPEMFQSGGDEGLIIMSLHV